MSEDPSTDKEAVAALARHFADRASLDFNLRTSGLLAISREYVAVVEPIIRADERAKVRAELLAIAAMFDPHEVTGHGGKPVHYLFIHAADRIAPE